MELSTRSEPEPRALKITKLIRFAKLNHLSERLRDLVCGEGGGAEGAGEAGGVDLFEC